MTRPRAAETIIEGLAAVELEAGPYTARFLPELGLVGSSLTHGGDEIVDFDLGRARDGATTGIALLHPWANRLSRLRYEVSGTWVELDGRPPVRLHDGLPIHGTMLGAPGWQVEAVLADGTRALFQARYAYDRPEQLRSFPFPHELVVFVELSDLGLRVTTELRAQGPRAVPVSFGWHPYLVVPGAVRADLSVELPDREHLELDGRGLPTGASKHEAAGPVALGAGHRATAFDDCYRLPTRRVLAVASAGRRVELAMPEGYGYGQVYAPTDSAVVALEPMTAPVDALVSGDHRLVPPDGRDTATFVLRVVDPTQPEEPDP